MVALGILGMLLVVDWYQQNREMDHLLDAVQRSEKAMKQFNADVKADIDPYATVDCSSSPSATFECQQAAQSLRTALSDTAAADLVDIRTTGAEVHHVSILPWHDALRDARAAYADHIKAWEDRVQSVASDPAALWDKVTGANITATFETAHRRFEDALPRLPLYDERQRVVRIWAD